MTLYDDYKNTDYLDDISFIAGSEQVLEFPIYSMEAGNSAIPLNGSEMTWLLGLYGQPEASPVLTKTATIDPVTGSKFIVTLTESDTINLGDNVYLQQPVITDGAGKKFRPGQGIVIIRKAIPES